MRCGRATEPVRVQRRADNSDVIMVCGQKIALGRLHKHKTVTITVSETTLAIDPADEDTRIVRRTVAHQPSKDHGIAACRVSADA